jgi:hypothetical protein
MKKITRTGLSENPVSYSGTGTKTTAPLNGLRLPRSVGLCHIIEDCSHVAKCKERLSIAVESKPPISFRRLVFAGQTLL